MTSDYIYYIYTKCLGIKNVTGTSKNREQARVSPRGEARMEAELALGKQNSDMGHERS